MDNIPNYLPAGPNPVLGGDCGTVVVVVVGDGDGVVVAVCANALPATAIVNTKANNKMSFLIMKYHLLAWLHKN